MESKENDGLKAALVLNVTLQDLARKEIPERIVFQRNYRYAEALAMPTYEGLAQAMSKGMEKFSRQLLTDLSKAIRK